MKTLYTVVTPSGVQWLGESLETAVRMWDSLTCRVDSVTPGGIKVELHEGGMMVRDGWILHVRENGVVYLSPSIVGA